MRKGLAVIAIAVTLTGAVVDWWRRHPRFGVGTVNRIVNPWLVRRGIARETHGEIALLEHVGRSTGTVRITPVHPVRTPDGFRIIVPLGGESQWARNVLAAGHCRLQVGDVVHELDEPSLAEPTRIEGVPRPLARVMAWLGFRYLRLHELTELQLEPEPSPVEAVAVAAG
jgi:deazaflavin-dependent oxidoreductase (nitroreductase family)